MTSNLQTVIYPVRDLAGAKALYGSVLGGADPVMDQPYYVQYNVGGLEIGLDPHGHNKGMTGPVAYWKVPDINAAFATLIASGAQQVQGVCDVGGRLIATVQDADGNTVGLLQEA